MKIGQDFPQLWLFPRIHHDCDNGTYHNHKEIVSN